MLLGRRKPKPTRTGAVLRIEWSTHMVIRAVPIIPRCIRVAWLGSGIDSRWRYIVSLLGVSVVGRVVGWVILMVLGIIGIYGLCWGRWEIVCFWEVSSF